MKKIPAFYFDPTYLSGLAEKHKKSFQDAKPYQHVVIDDFLPKEILDIVIKEFPKHHQIPWHVAGPGTTKIIQDKVYLNKLSSNNENHFGPMTRHLMMVFNSFTFLLFLEGLTGLTELVPDPSFRGCGLHSTGRGGKLMIHTDASRHPNRKCDQMLNMLLFINKDWKEEYGGHFEMWDIKGKKCVKKVAPIYNRLVIFNTGTNTYHGHPHPLNCPENMRRNSLSVYYYVIGRPKDKNYERNSSLVMWHPTQKDEFEYINELQRSGKIKMINGVPTVV